jgi:hypothetical protein
VRLVSLLAVSGALACSGSTPDGAAAVTPPEQKISGKPPEGAGLGAWKCPPGEALLANGGCKPAGISPGECSKGFEHDGIDGCKPILPASECPSGQLAIPGDTSCRPVAPCGNGKWGDITIGPDTEFVDATFVGVSDGSMDKPWSKIEDAVKDAAPGATVAIAAGRYPLKVAVNKPVTIWGKCPAEVELGAANWVLQFNAGSSGSLLRGVAVTGKHATIKSAPNGKITFDQIWVHDGDDAAVNIFRSTQATGAVEQTIRRSLFERVGD